MFFEKRVGSRTRAAGRRVRVCSPRRAEPRLLFRDGIFLDSAMRGERVTHDEAQAAMRESGLGSTAEVSAMILETTGPSRSFVNRARQLERGRRGTRGRRHGCVGGHRPRDCGRFRPARLERRAARARRRRARRRSCGRGARRRPRARHRDRRRRSGAGRSGRRAHRARMGADRRVGQQRDGDDLLRLPQTSLRRTSSGRPT